MSIVKIPQTSTSVYLCHFQCYISEVSVYMKFPCQYFVQWRTISSKAISKTQKYGPQDNKIIINQKMNLRVQMIYDNISKQFVKRQTLIQLYLISKSRPDQAKLVGRVNIEVNKIINYGVYEEFTIFGLNCSSVEGTITMKFKVLSKEQTSNDAKNVDKSSFVEYVSRLDFKSENKYQSIVLSKYLNKSPLQKSINSQIKKSHEYDKQLNKRSLLNESLLLLQPTQKSSFAKGLVNNQNIKVFPSQIQGRQSNVSFSKLMNVNQKGQDRVNLNKLKEQKEALLRQVAQLLRINDSYGKEIQESKSQNAQKDREVAELKEQILKLIKSNQNQRNYIDQLQSNHSRQSQHFQITQSRLIQQKLQLIQKHTLLVSQLQQAKSLNLQLKTEVNAFQSVNSQLKLQIVELKNGEAQTQRLRQQLKKQMIKKQTLMHIKSRAQSLQVQNMLLNRRIKEQQDSIVNYEAKFNNFEQLIVKLEQDNQKCHERVRQSEEIEMKLMAKIQQLQAQNNQLVIEIDTNLELKQQIVELKKHIAEKESQIWQLSEQVKRMSEQMSALRTQLLIIQEQNQRINLQCENLHKQALQKQQEINRSVQSVFSPLLEEKQNNNVKEQQCKSNNSNILSQQNNQRQQNSSNLKDQYDQSQVYSSKQQISSQQHQRGQANGNKCREYQDMLCQIKEALENLNKQNKEYINIISKYKQKQTKLMDNLAILEGESQNVMLLLHQKQKEQEESKLLIQQLQNKLIYATAFKLQQCHRQQFEPILQQQYESSSIFTYNQLRKDQLLKKYSELSVNRAQIIELNGQMKQKIQNTGQEVVDLLLKHRLQRKSINNSLKQLQQFYGLQKPIESKRNNECENNLNNSSQKSQLCQYDIFKDKSKQRQFYEFQQQFNKLKAYVQTLQGQKDEFKVTIAQQSNIINQLSSSNQELLDILHKKQQGFISMIVFNVLDQLKSMMLKDVSQNDWNDILKGILDKSIIKQNVQRLISIEQKVGQLNKEIQKIKFQIITNSKQDILNFIRQCQCILVQLLKTVTIIYQ